MWCNILILFVNSLEHICIVYFAFYELFYILFPLSLNFVYSIYIYVYMYMYVCAYYICICMYVWMYVFMHACSDRNYHFALLLTTLRHICSAAFCTHFGAQTKKEFFHTALQCIKMMSHFSFTKPLSSGMWKTLEVSTAELTVLWKKASI